MSVSRMQEQRAHWATQERLRERTFGDTYPGRPVVESAGEPYVHRAGKRSREPWEAALIARLRGGRVN